MESLRFSVKKIHPPPQRFHPGAARISHREAVFHPPKGWISLKKGQAKRLVLFSCVKTSPMIKNHRGALLSTLYTRLYHISWYLHDFALILPFSMSLHDSSLKVSLLPKLLITSIPAGTSSRGLSGSQATMGSIGCLLRTLLLAPPTTSTSTQAASIRLVAPVATAVSQPAASPSKITST